MIDWYNEKFDWTIKIRKLKMTREEAETKVAGLDFVESLEALGLLKFEEASKPVPATILKEFFEVDLPATLAAETIIILNRNGYIIVKK